MIIAVHDGPFHKDDVIAVALAMIERENIKKKCDIVKIIRTRDKNKLDDADIVLDVGGTYNGVKYFDHHQEDVPVYSNGVKCAACGLYLKNMHSLTDDEKQYLLDNALYAVQAHDNGQDLDSLGFSLSEDPFSFVSLLNGTWKEGVYTSEQNGRFEYAAMTAKCIIRRMLRQCKHKTEAKKKVNYALNSSLKNKDGILFIGEYCDWKEEVIEYNELYPENIVEVVVYSNSQGQFNVQVVPEKIDSFESYVSIPKEVENIEGCVFRHKAGFLAGFDNVLGALEAARITVEYESEGYEI